jgi:hypothetical protein
MCIYSSLDPAKPAEVALIIAVKEAENEGFPRVMWTELVNGKLSDYRDAPNFLRERYTVVGSQS